MDRNTTDSEELDGRWRLQSYSAYKTLYYNTYYNMALMLKQGVLNTINKEQGQSL